MAQIIRPGDLVPAPGEPLLTTIRREIVNYHRQGVMPMAAQINALAYDLESLGLIMDQAMEDLPVERLDQIRALSAGRRERWRIMHLPRTVLIHGADGHPEVVGAIDETADGYTIHVLTEDTALAERLAGQDYTDRDKGRAIRAAMSAVEWAQKCIREGTSSGSAS